MALVRFAERRLRLNRQQRAQSAAGNLHPARLPEGHRRADPSLRLHVRNGASRCRPRRREEGNALLQSLQSFPPDIGSTHAAQLDALVANLDAGTPAI
jgi:hypothetical protein